MCWRGTLYTFTVSPYVSRWPVRAVSHVLTGFSHVTRLDSRSSLSEKIQTNQQNKNCNVLHAVIDNSWTAFVTTSPTANEVQLSRSPLQNANASSKKPTRNSSQLRQISGQTGSHSTRLFSANSKLINDSQCAIDLYNRFVTTRPTRFMGPVILKIMTTLTNNKCL